ncbi:MAG: hypothetical protein M3Q69_02365 [Acidobacteriota bacterium]|nr:hypothetical protein [Acidobacteriota bacterium]
MRRLFLAIHIFVTVAVSADVISSDRIGPARGRRETVVASGSSTRFCAAWFDSRRSVDYSATEILFADGDGSDQLEGEENAGTGIFEYYPGERLAIGCEGDSLLILSVDKGARVRNGRVETFKQPLKNVRALTWNGTHYVAVFGTTVVLLDRDGQLASGELRGLPLAVPGRFLLACDSQTCVGSKPGSYASIQFSLSDVPPRGQRAANLTWRSAQEIAGTDRSGVYVVSRAPGGLVIRRPEPTSKHRAAGPQPPATIIPAPSNAFLLQTVAHGDAIYILYRVGSREEILCVKPEGTSVVAAASELMRDEQLVDSPSGPIVIWRRGEQLYFAPVTSGAWPNRGTLLTTSRPEVSVPRVVRGNGGFLAAWVETLTRDELMIATLTADGHLLGKPLTLDAGTISNVTLFFDGANYAVMWSDWDKGVLLQPVSSGGVPIGEPFDPSPRSGMSHLLGSIAMDAGSYLISTGDGVARITPRGQFLELINGPTPSTTDGRAAVFFERRGDSQRFAAVLMGDWHPLVEWPVEYEYAAADFYLSPSSEGFEPWSDDDVIGYTAVSPGIVTSGRNVMRIVCNRDGALFDLDTRKALPQKCASINEVERIDAFPMAFGAFAAVAFRDAVVLYNWDRTVASRATLPPRVITSSATPIDPANVLVVAKRYGDQVTAHIETLRVDFTSTVFP